MVAHQPFAPDAIFTADVGQGSTPPRVLATPSRYIQGDGILAQLGHYLALVPGRHAVILISAGGLRRDGARIRRGLEEAGAIEADRLGQEVARRVGDAAYRSLHPGQEVHG